jgi:SAM-dependent methyltransferase
MDRSNGYEGVSEEFLARRGSSTRSTGIGVKEVRKWARTLPRGCSVIDLGCGPGFPITVVLVEEGLRVFGVDAAPSFVAAFHLNRQTRRLEGRNDRVGISLPGGPAVQKAAPSSWYIGHEEYEDEGENHYFDAARQKIAEENSLP